MSRPLRLSERKKVVRDLIWVQRFLESAKMPNIAKIISIIVKILESEIEYLEQK